MKKLIAFLFLISQSSVVCFGVSYHLTKTIPVNGDSGWDYLTIDSMAKRFYVTRGTYVSVYDLITMKEVGKIEDTNGVHGVALATDLKKGFTSNGKSNDVTIFDLASLKPLGRIATGKKPDAILYDSHSKRVLTFNGESNDVTVIDAQVGKLLGTIPLRGKPEFAAVDHDGNVYVNIEDKNAITVIDPVKMDTVETWSITGCEEPSGLSIDADHHRLFSGCHNKVLAVVDSQTGRSVATLPIGKGVDATAFDPKQQLAFSSNGDGTLTVIKEVSPEKFEVAENVPTQQSARTMAVDQVTHRIYSIAAKMESRPPASVKKGERSKIVPNSVVLLVIEPTT